MKYKPISPYVRLQTDVHGALSALFNKLRRRTELAQRVDPTLAVAIQTANALGFVVVAEANGNSVTFSARAAVAPSDMPYEVRPWEHSGGERL